ncbi:MAG: glycosyltransferase [Bacteroidia bacterium]
MLSFNHLTIQHSQKPNVILAVTNDLAGDQRVHRIASALQQDGYEVLVVGRLLSSSRQLAPRSYLTRRMKLRFERGKQFYAEYNYKLYQLLMTQPKGIWVANDLDTFLAVSQAARKKGSKVVYDSHEYFTEVPELVGRPWVQKFWLNIEKRLFPKADAAYTVNQSIADIYSEKYNRQVDVVRNLPTRKPATGPKPSERIIIYQGALNLGRGIELMIDTMEHLPGYHLWIIGRGDIEPALRSRAEHSPTPDRIEFKGFVPWEKLHPITAQASLGFSLEEDFGLNYRYASPNKVYDYIQAETPVLVSDLPEMRATVEQHGVGQILPGSDRKPRLLAERVKRLVEGHGYSEYQDACRKAAQVLCWEEEKKVLLEVFEGL